MSDLEDKLAFHIRATNLPSVERQYKFHPTRRWKADFCWVKEKLIVEVQGGIWIQGRHSRGGGYTKDCEKMNEAVLMGYKYLKVTKEHINSGQAILWVEKVLQLN